MFSNKTSTWWWRQYLALQRPSSFCQFETSDCRADRWLSHMGNVQFHTQNQCLAWNNFMRLIQIWQLFVVVHSQNTVSSLLESWEDLAFKCIAVELCCNSTSQNSNRDQPIIPIFDCLKIKWFPLIFFLRHLCLLTDQAVVTAWPLSLQPQVSANSDVES